MACTNTSILARFVEERRRAKYVTRHTLACLTRQGAEELARRLAAATEIAARRVQVNLVEEKMVVEFEVPDRELLAAWLKKNSSHYDWLLRVELESEGGRFVPA